MGDKAQQQTGGRKRLLVQQQRPRAGLLLGSRSSGGEWYPHRCQGEGKQGYNSELPRSLILSTTPFPSPERPPQALRRLILRNGFKVTLMRIPRPGCVHIAPCNPRPGLFDQGLFSLPSVVLSDLPSAVWITFPMSLIAHTLLRPYYSMELASTPWRF